MTMFTGWSPHSELDNSSPFRVNCRFMGARTCLYSSECVSLLFEFGLLHRLVAHRQRYGIRFFCKVQQIDIFTIRHVVPQTSSNSVWTDMQDIKHRGNVPTEYFAVGIFLSICGRRHTQALLFFWLVHLRARVFLYRSKLIGIIKSADKAEVLWARECGALNCVRTRTHRFVS